MATKPKLTALDRADIANTVEKRRALTRMIAKLLYEKRQLPNNRALAKSKNVHYSVVRRALYGDPYKV